MNQTRYIRTGPEALARLGRGFTMLELMVVVVVIGILAAVVVPAFGGVTNEAKTASLQGTLGAVRSSIAAFRSRGVITGSGTYPTLAQLRAVGTVVQQALPTNPYNKMATVQSVTLSQANARTVVNPTRFGWNYFVDNASSPPRAIFYANTTSTTTATDQAGRAQTGNQL